MIHSLLAYTFIYHVFCPCVLITSIIIFPSNFVLILWRQCTTLRWPENTMQILSSSDIHYDLHENGESIVSILRWRERVKKLWLLLSCKHEEGSWVVGWTLLGIWDMWNLFSIARKQAHGPCILCISFCIHLHIKHPFVYEIHASRRLILLSLLIFTIQITQLC